MFDICSILLPFLAVMFDIESYLNSIDYYLPINSSSSAVDFLLEALYSDAVTPIEGFFHRG